MARFSFGLIVALLASSATAEKLAWSDEFDYTGAIDTTAWTHDIGNWGWGNQEFQNYTDNLENVRVADGKLTITAKREPSGLITSGRVKTLGKVTVKYGRIEASIKVPDLVYGLWPAFWTLGNNFPIVGWPACGELDVMEMGSAMGYKDGVPMKRVGSAAHWDNFGGYAMYTEHIDMPEDLNGGFHNFSMSWTPQYVTTHLDGNHVWTININATACPGCTEFHEPHFVILNLAVGGTYTGIMNPGGVTAPIPAEYVIDYVRIYENEWTELAGRKFFEAETLTDCTCPGYCNDTVLDMITTDTEGSYTCRERMEYVISDYFGTEKQACTMVSRQFPDECNIGCNPQNCGDRKPVLTDCGCGANCLAAFDNEAKDWEGAYSCQQRMLWIMEFMGKSEADSCGMVGAQFPACSMCNPGLCDYTPIDTEPTTSAPATPATPTFFESETPMPATTLPILTAAPTPAPVSESVGVIKAVNICGCGIECDDVWDTMAGDHPCGARIEWVLANALPAPADACALIAASEFPGICGACDPYTCNIVTLPSITAAPTPVPTPPVTAAPAPLPTPLPIAAKTGVDSIGDCGCGAKCVDEIYRMADGHTCQARMIWSLGVDGTGEKACLRVASTEFPHICGACDPSTCNSASMDGGVTPVVEEVRYEIVDCGCGSGCIAALNNDAAGFTCEARMKYVLGSEKTSETKACEKIGSEQHTVNHGLSSRWRSCDSRES